MAPRTTASTRTTQAPLIAAATRVNLGGKRKAVLREAGITQQAEWQKDAIAYFDLVPELKQATWMLGNLMAKVRLYPAVEVEVDGEDGEAGSTRFVHVLSPDSGIDPALAMEAVAQLARLQSGLGGQPEILRAMSMNMEITGEGFIVGIGARPPRMVGTVEEPGTPERWEVLSIKEVKVEGRLAGKARITVTLNGTDLVLDDTKGDVLVRVWQRHPIWSGKADCALHGSLVVCKILDALTAQVLATTNSQMNSGIWVLPSEARNATAYPAIPPANANDTRSNLERTLDEMFSLPIEQPEDLSTIRPGILFLDRQDAELVTQGSFIRFDRKFDDSLDARIESNVTRLGRGLNMPLESMEGHMSTTFANARQIDQDLWDDHLDPRARVLVDAVTIGFLQPELLTATTYGEGGVVTNRTPVTDPARIEQVDRIVCMYDPADVIPKPDTAEAADTGLKHGALSNAGWRRHRGFSESDAPSVEERLERLAAERGAIPAQLTVTMLQDLADEAGLEWPDPEDVANAPAPGAPGEAVAALLTAAASAPLGTRLARMDQRLMDRQQSAANAAMERALERAGNRLRSRVRGTDAHAIIQRVAPRQIAATLGRAAVQAAAGDNAEDDLFDGAFDEWAAGFLTAIRSTQRNATTLIRDRVPAADIPADVYQADAEAAAAWAEAEIRQVAAGRLFDPDPAVEALGEADVNDRVPRGLIRQALQRAGGSRGLEAFRQDGGYIAMAKAGTRDPAGLVATGDTAMTALRNAGATVTGYTWDAAAVAHPFHPHHALDGRTFPTWDSPILANGTGWPPFDHYFPGDHGGCGCTATPTIVTPGA